MRNRRFGGTWLFAFLLLSFPCGMQAQEKSVQPGINKTFEDPELNVATVDGAVRERGTRNL